MSRYDDDDELLPDDEETPPAPPPPPRPVRTGTRAPAAAGGPWKVLVVDDDRAVRMVSELALKGLHVDGTPIQLMLTANAAEARPVLADHPDLAVALIDVIMETRSAGIDLVDWIRNTLGNESIRLVIRTGEPGSAPEPSVMADHDLHDYLAKTETTARRLVSCVTGAIRAWRDQQVIRRQEAGLRGVLAAVDGLFDDGDAASAAEGAVRQALALLAPAADAGWLVRSTDADGHQVVAAVGAGPAGAPAATGGALPDGEVFVLRDEAWYAFTVEDGPDRPPRRWALGVRHAGLSAFDLQRLALYGRALTLSLRHRTTWQREVDTLAHAVAEREVLLREIHHRVKNNLQITSSLLGMQADDHPSADVRSALTGASGRVRAMALVHDQLYRSDDLTQIAFDEFVPSLVRPLVASLGPTAQVEFALEPVRFSLERSIPMGLILNELLTNAFKYGRSADGQLRIHVGLRRVGDAASLLVRDDGPGFGSAFSDRSQNLLGLRIVTALAQQVRAAVTTNREPGAAVTVTVTLTPEER